MIYFLQPAEGGPIKIGYTDNLSTRHRQLEAHYGRPLALLATMEGGYEEEHAIHSRFAHLRLDGRGRRGLQPEQFRPTQELMAFIGRPLLVGANAEAVEAISPLSPLSPPSPLKTIGIKASPGWADWLERFARHQRTTVASLVDRALAQHAEQEGFKETPPERIP